MASSSYDIPKQHDARGLLIPDDIVRNSGYVKSNPETFWSSYQIFIKADEEDVEDGVKYLDMGKARKKLSAIPDPHFRYIRSLCLDFGWCNARGCLKDCTYSIRFRTEVERLIQYIRRRKNSKLVIKLLWSTTIYHSRERLVR